MCVLACSTLLYGTNHHDGELPWCGTCHPVLQECLWADLAWRAVYKAGVGLAVSIVLFTTVFKWMRRSVVLFTAPFQPVGSWQPAANWSALSPGQHWCGEGLETVKRKGSSMSLGYIHLEHVYMSVRIPGALLVRHPRTLCWTSSLWASRPSTRSRTHIWAVSGTVISLGMGMAEISAVSKGWALNSSFSLPCSWFHKPRDVQIQRSLIKHPQRNKKGKKYAVDPLVIRNNCLVTWIFNSINELEPQLHPQEQENNISPSPLPPHAICRWGKGSAARRGLMISHMMRWDVFPLLSLPLRLFQMPENVTSCLSIFQYADAECLEKQSFWFEVIVSENSLNITLLFLSNLFFCIRFPNW